MIEHLERLFAHVQWADERLLEGLRSSPGEDPAALEYFAHVLAAEELWLARIEERAPRTAVWPRSSLDELALLARTTHQGYRDLIARTRPEAVGREIAYTNSAGLHFVTRLDDILLHVALHGAYHRGQVSLMVRRSGGTPAPTDYIAFIRGAPAATRGDAERRA